ncbi:carbohydrate ABC transporter permease [Demequina muriae]|uniref:Carbohydrate ABC transporter permease n=1 Tax=Demequina muriae TaxID=3051664 RepID=A0ABT8GIA6_9MICO|nr:carbohydrate ABC transporter permease [Demequina sp. EGI L300058]MDN4481155.1 carbohydrate ABC transporter permease [Demequina sp. EGI L300058]
MARSRKHGAANIQRPTWFVYGALAAVLVASLFPFYWTLLIGSGDSSTLRDPNMSWIPGGNFIDNAMRVIENPAVNFWKALGNSIIVSTTVALSTVVLSTLAGFAFAKLRFKGNGVLYVAVIATMAVPVQLGIVPLYILMAEYGWTGTLGAVIVPALVTAFGVFWMTQYLQQALPTELIEAARVDGCNMIRTFWHVAVPAARPAASMLFLFTFVTAWNNFLWPLIILDQSNPTLPVALSMLQANYFVDYSLVLAGVLLATVPLLILFVFTGRQLVTGIMQGALKG